eukprot:1584861-Rhodomonas_salina.2
MAVPPPDTRHGLSQHGAALGPALGVSAGRGPAGRELTNMSSGARSLGQAQAHAAPPAAM